MPAVFTIYSVADDGKAKKHKIEVGDPDENENFNDKGQSVTQKPKKYSFEFNGDKFNIIDTPGLTDSRELEQNKLNLDLIKEEMKTLDVIHGICIVLKSNEQKFSSAMEKYLSDLLSIFPKTAVNNIFYLFTHSREIFRGIGHTNNFLKIFAKNFKLLHGVELEFSEDRIFYSESYAFEYLIAFQNRYYCREKDEYLKDMWNRTSRNINRFLKEIKTITPILVSEI